MNWISFQPALPAKVTSAAEDLTTGLGAAQATLQAAKALLATKTALANDRVVGALASSQGIVSSAFDAVEAGINALLDDGGGYALVVPLPKKGIASLVEGVIGLTTSAPAGALNSRTPASVRALQVWRQAFNEEALFTGGNAHFLRTVAESLYDAGDDNRPTFGADSFWGYAALITGASDVAAGVNAAAYLERLLGTVAGTASTLTATRSHGSVVAQGVRVRPTPRNAAAVIEWLPPTSVPADDGVWRVVPTHYAIIRSERPQALSARQVLDLFTSRDLQEGMTGRHGARVLKVARNDGLVGRFVDAGPLTTQQAYYYHVAVRTRLDGPDRREEHGYAQLSSCARLRLEAGRSRGGRPGAPPDWYRLPSLARLIPAMGETLDTVLETLKVYGNAGERAQGLSASALSALEREIAKYGDLVGSLGHTLGQLQSVFSAPAVGVSLALRSGRGSAATMLADLASALEDRTDPARPAFDTGSEYVAGAMILVVAPSEAAFQRTWAALQLLLGPEEENDPVLAGIRDIQAGLSTQAGALTDEAPSLTFNNDMTAREPGQGDASCEET